MEIMLERDFNLPNGGLKRNFIEVQALNKITKRTVPAKHSLTAS